MTKRMIVSTAVLLFLLGLMCLANVRTAPVEHPVPPRSYAVAEPHFQAIACTDNKAVARAIYVLFKADPILKRDPILEDQLGHINASFKNGVVKLRGWAFGPIRKVSDQKGVNRAIKLARQASDCVTNVISKLKSTRKIQCPPGFVSCGTQGLCIPAGEDCNAGTMP